jgi:DNA-binding NarL/FixJ family response regulator
VDIRRRLTGRERQVLDLVAHGCTNRAIATRIGVAERTVEGHIKRIFDKLRLEEHPDSNRRVLATVVWLNDDAAASWSVPTHH